MKHARTLLLFLAVSTLSACNSNNCTESEAYNKMLALGKFQGRIITSGTAASMTIAAAISTETGAISELIAAKKFSAACAKADEVAKGFDLDLKAEQKGMVTFEELQKDGGKRGGECSLAEAAQRNMAFHGKLQEQVNAGKVDSEVFRQYNEDTKSFSELMSTDPSAVCRKLDELKAKYKVDL